MTPIKDIILCGNVVATRDQANGVHIVAIAPSPKDAEWLAWSLGRAHSVEVVTAVALPPMGALHDA